MDERKTISKTTRFSERELYDLSLIGDVGPALHTTLARYKRVMSENLPIVGAGEADTLCECLDGAWRGYDSGNPPGVLWALVLETYPELAERMRTWTNAENVAVLVACESVANCGLPQREAIKKFFGV